jgi:hypothetical protein
LKCFRASSIGFLKTVIQRNLRSSEDLTCPAVSPNGYFDRGVLQILLGVPTPARSGYGDLRCVMSLIFTLVFFLRGHGWKWTPPKHGITRRRFERVNPTFFFSERRLGHETLWNAFYYSFLFTLVIRNTFEVLYGKAQYWWVYRQFQTQTNAFMQKRPCLLSCCSLWSQLTLLLFLCARKGQSVTRACPTLSQPELPTA